MHEEIVPRSSLCLLHLVGLTDGGDGSTFSSSLMFTSLEYATDLCTIGSVPARGGPRVYSMAKCNSDRGALEAAYRGKLLKTGPTV